VLGVVDSSGLYAGAEREIKTDFSLEGNPFSTSITPAAVQRFQTRVRFFPDLKTADDSLRAGSISQLLVIPANFRESGQLRRYARSSNLFSSAENRPLSRWLVANLLGHRVDSLTIERVARPLAGMDLYVLNKRGEYEIKDDRREMFDFFLPFSFGMLLGLCIVIGGQYLLQGVSEEKESRILESLLCTVTSEELLAGKLIGLGGGGLTLVAFWSAAGAFFAGPAAAIAKISPPPALLLAMIAYLLLGYLFYGSLMTGIGAITNSMREAQQFAFMFTFANWVPFIMLTAIIGKPDGGLAVGLSMFPPTAPVTMMMRLSSPSAAVPLWQVGVSMALLAGTAFLALIASARIFRVGLLMYGKTPTLPEILRWSRRG
jgi:ABC-2 type transport system permease protein